MIKDTLLSYAKLGRQFPREMAFALWHSFFSGYGQTFFIAFLIPQIKDTYLVGDNTIGLAYGSLTLLSALLIPHVGKLIDTLHLKAYAMITLGVLTAGMLILAHLPRWEVMLVGLFLLRFCGQGLFGHIAATSVVRYFEAERGKALGLGLLGLPFAEAILPLLFVFLLPQLGWQTTLTVFALIPLVIFGIFYLVLFPNQHPFLAPIPQSTDGQPKPNAWRVLGDPKFLIVLAQFVLPPFLLTGLFFHKISIGDFKGWTQTFIAQCFVVAALTKVPASILIGPLIDAVTARKISRFYLVPMFLSLFFLWISNSPFTAVLYMAFAGLTIGIGLSLHSAVWGEMYAPNQLGAIKGIVMQFTIAGTALAPPVFGFAIEAGLDLSYILVAGMVLTIATATSQLIAWPGD